MKSQQAHSDSIQQAGRDVAQGRAQVEMDRFNRLQTKDLRKSISSAVRKDMKMLRKMGLLVPQN